MRKLRRRGPPPVTLTAGLFVAAGVGAAGVMYSDRLSDLWQGSGWAEPSPNWTALFNEKGPPKAIPEAKVANAVLITPPPAARAPEPLVPPVQEPPRRPDEAARLLESARPESPSSAAAPSNPGTTASLGAASRELPWLPQTEKRAEPLEAASAPPPRSVAPEPPPPPRVVAPEPPPPPAPSPPPAASAPAVVLSAAEVAELIRRARERIDLGDISGARLLLERAAAGSEPSALMALAETYDPSMLAKWGARGLKADPGKARALYQKAAERGLAEARTRMLALR